MSIEFKVLYDLVLGKHEYGTRNIKDLIDWQRNIDNSSYIFLGYRLEKSTVLQLSIFESLDKYDPSNSTIYKQLYFKQWINSVLIGRLT